MKPKVYTLPGGYDEKHGYCAQLVELREYEDLQFEVSQMRKSHAALRQAVRRAANAKTIFARADLLAKRLGVVA